MRPNLHFACPRPNLHFACPGLGVGGGGMGAKGAGYGVGVAIHVVSQVGMMSRHPWEQELRFCYEIMCL